MTDHQNTDRFLSKENYVAFLIFIVFKMFII